MSVGGDIIEVIRDRHSEPHHRAPREQWSDKNSIYCYRSRYCTFVSGGMITCKKSHNNYAEFLPTESGYNVHPVHYSGSNQLFSKWDMDCRTDLTAYE